MYFVGTDSSSFDSDTLGVKFFSQLKHAGFFPSRTVESLRDRYKRYLSCLKGSDIVKVGGWVIENGVLDAFLEFSFFFESERMEMVRKLEKIVKVKLSYAVSDQEEGEQEEQEEQEEKKYQFVEDNKVRMFQEQQQIIADQFKFPNYFINTLTSNKQKIWQIGPYNLFLNEQMFCSQSNYRDIEIQINTNFEGQRSIKKDLEKEEQLLQDQLEIICDQFSITKDHALDCLDAVSGNFKDLYYYLRNEDDSILWLEEDDAVLKELLSIEQPAFQLLLRQKGKERIRSRLKYRNIVLPFNF
eukprot:TRINITY_DN5547_c0_g1_i2.p1 TRINITY_DN5547_c0_g1~~TRINITY_DN5547_c0_g1_i2.p1  ORF type:complete len:299 (-),score=47.02 TRINITY_DN5547_c0_g1_i2:188-1084(-)